MQKPRCGPLMDVCVCVHSYLNQVLYLLIRSSVLFHFTGKCDIAILRTYFESLDLKPAIIRSVPKLKQDRMYV